VPYRAVIQSWHDFYIVAGTVSATLLGLLFVGLSLHLRVVVSRSEVRSLARVTLANLGIIVILSLFLVIPEGLTEVKLQLLISGVIGLVVIFPSIVSALRSETRTLHGIRLMVRIGLSGLAYVGVILASRFFTQRSYGGALSVLVAVIVILLVISLRNSWDMLVSVGEVALEQRSSESD
jgi:peptidoglycan biosynthesis protein MviN/MurJ (putative lipid II flippase)